MAAARKTAVVIGGGVVGLCTASELARRGAAVVLIERHGRLFEETSTHNSGVVHAGFYYPPGSRRARTCVVGNRLTWEFCDRHEIAHRRSGKLVVAWTPGEAAKLKDLLATARANGANVAEAAAGQCAEREPSLKPPLAALWSPHTGVLDVGGYLLAREREARSLGAEILVSAEVLSVRGDPPVVESTRGAVEAHVVVNAAGLWTDDVERRATLFRSVGRLPADQRRVIVMRFAEEKSIREIAQEIGRSEGAVKQLQWRGLQSLRAQMIHG